MENKQRGEYMLMNIVELNSSVTLIWRPSLPNVDWGSNHLHLTRFYHQRELWWHFEIEHYTESGAFAHFLCDSWTFSLWLHCIRVTVLHVHVCVRVFSRKKEDCWSPSLVSSAHAPLSIAVGLFICIKCSCFNKAPFVWRPTHTFMESAPVTPHLLQLFWSYCPQIMFLSPLSGF